VDFVKKNRVHPCFYSEYSLSERVEVSGDLRQVMAESQVLLLAIPSMALPEFLEEMKGLVAEPMVVVSLIKALAERTGQRMTEMMAAAWAGEAVETAVLAGGMVDKDVLGGQFLGATVASDKKETALRLKSLLESRELWIEVSTDVVGVELAGAFKNVVAIFAGMVAGLGGSYGSETYTMARVAAECERLAVALGARAETFRVESQCWGNDMLMSATGKTRNRELGLVLGAGYNYEQAVAKMTAANKLAEGAQTMAILPKLADLGEYPLLNFVYKLTRGEGWVHQLPQVLRGEE
jgi:glycerol-3-phosphate dehydrogenase (NAD(P)+)